MFGVDAYDDKELVQLLSMRNCDPDMYSMLDPSKEDIVRRNNDEYMSTKLIAVYFTKKKDKGKRRLLKRS